MAQSRSADKTLRMLAGARHGDCFYRETTYDEVGVWLGKQVGSSQPYATKELALEVRVRAASAGQRQCLCHRRPARTRAGPLVRDHADVAAP